MEKTLSVIIVTWNNEGTIYDCLKSVYRSSSRLDVEVIVVDNASNDRTIEVIENNFPQTTILRLEQNIGFSKGNNIGIMSCSGEYVLILNPDTELPPRVPRECLSFMSGHPRAGMCGVELANPDGSLQTAHFSFPGVRDVIRLFLGVNRRYYRALIEKYNSPSVPVEVDWISGAFMFVRRKSIQDVGAFDERLFMYGEEIDWCSRFHAKGWEVWLIPGIRVLHHHRQSTSQSNAPLHAYSVYGIVVFFLSRRPLIQAFSVITLAYITGMAFIMRGSFVSRQKRIVGLEISRLTTKALVNRSPDIRFLDYEREA
jgi:GT2 family glycosyltransferase